MKKEKAYVDKRRKDILSKLVENPDIRVDELASIFNVSLVTIRRDLNYLEGKNLLVRSYGGATPTDIASKGDPLREVDDVTYYRNLIARYAATLVEDDDTIFINTSRNALDVIQYMKGNNISVITNNGRAINCNNPSKVNIYLTGGEIRYPKEALVGEFAERNLLKVYAKKSFIGCSGISADFGMTTENVNEVHLNELMIQRTMNEAYILADHTKIGANSSFRSCGIDKIKHLITDELAPKDVIDAFRERGIDVYQVSRKNQSEW